MSPHSQYDADDVLIVPSENARQLTGWRVKCPVCEGVHTKPFHVETDVCLRCEKKSDTSPQAPSGAANGHGAT